MKYKYLRSHIKSTQVQKQFNLKNCNLVIDARSFFADAYKRSGCQFILGGEYDRFANYLKNILNSLIESRVTCYVVFNGAINADLDKRKEIHQNTINNSDAIKPGYDENNYSEPVFVKDVCKQVLDELGIKHFVAEYDNREDLFNVAKKFNCPVLTTNYEYCLYGVSCILPNSLVFNKETKSIACNIFPKHASIGVSYEMMPILMSLIDEDSLHFRKLPEVIACRRINLIPSVLRWVRRQNKTSAIAIADIMKNLTDIERTSFTKSYEENEKLCQYNPKSLAVSYFQLKTEKTLHIKDPIWFAKGVASGRFAVPYINLKNNGTFSGSGLIVDKDKEDAMLPAIDIIMYVNALMTNSHKGKITFIGRKFDKSTVWEIESDIQMAISNKKLFLGCMYGTNYRVKGAKEDLFYKFLNKSLPGFNFQLLQSVPEDIWVLLISLVYYCKINKDFVNFAYSILLSYVMLGPVSEIVGIIKRSNFFVSHNDFDDEDKTSNTNDLTGQDCAIAVSKVITLFYLEDVKRVFNRSILHNLAEFQHCLQHMNYLNNLCGGTMKSTVYHKAFNATFVYNAFLKTQQADPPMKYFEKLLGKSPVFEYYKKIEAVFDECHYSVQ